MAAPHVFSFVFWALYRNECGCAGMRPSQGPSFDAHPRVCTFGCSCSVSMVAVNDVILLPADTQFTYSMGQTPILSAFPMAFASSQAITLYGSLVRAPPRGCQQYCAIVASLPQVGVTLHPLARRRRGVVVGRSARHATVWLCMKVEPLHIFSFAAGVGASVTMCRWDAPCAARYNDGRLLAHRRYPQVQREPGLEHRPAAEL